MQERPQARSEGVLIQQVEDDLVVYDERSQVAHCLSSAAASVWERCDGQSSREEIAHGLGLARTVVDQALDELDNRSLLEEGPQGYSRREAAMRLAKIGGVAATAPMIYSVVVPAAVSAASGCLSGGAQIAAGGTCNAAAGSFGTSDAAANCCNNSCYQGSTNGTFYCGSAATCSPVSGNCNSGRDGGLPCCAGGGQINGNGNCGAGNNCTQ